MQPGLSFYSTTEGSESPSVVALERDRNHALQGLLLSLLAEVICTKSLGWLPELIVLALAYCCAVGIRVIEPSGVEEVKGLLDLLLRLVRVLLLLLPADSGSWHRMALGMFCTRIPLRKSSTQMARREASDHALATMLK